MRILYGLLACLAVLAGCMQVGSTPLASVPPSALNTAKAAAKDVLKDPDSAKFKPGYQAYRLENGDLVVCGVLNAKNSFGGYVGYEPYYVRLRSGQVMHVRVDGENASLACNSAAAGSVNISN
ncbi:hypothetical protein [Phaeobacter italicus]|jgi:hypothetical protein|uniref:hypothetical protein n=1 Tax=Phaeobacter italicus TaxID=481446 RepID=UPI002FD89382